MQNSNAVISGFALNLFLVLLSQLLKGVQLFEFLKSLFKTFLAINIFFICA